MYPNCQLQKWGNNFIGGVALSESKKDIITNHVITLCLIWRSLHAFHNHKETKVPKLCGSLIACDVLTRALRQENSCTCSSEREKHADTDIQCRRVCACVCVCVCVCVCHSVMSDSLQPRGLLPTRLLYPWDSPGENTEDIVIPFSRGCSWPRYLTWVSYISRQILYHLSQQGSLCRRIHTAKESEKPASRYKVIDKEWEWDKPDDFTEGLAFQ